ncbi:MAG: hypothetical protein CSA62_08290 [Planctomycetota bacterium]|nr:MAG: hypothetical protein CSA62_08290 [Planctomycetota bacterium]
MTEFCLECSAVSVIRKGPGGEERALLCQIDLALRPASCNLLLGPTGSGKSTLLQVLAGLQRPSEGELRAFGEPVSRWTAGHRDLWRRRVGMAFQDPELFEELTVEENIAAPLLPRAMSHAAKRQACQSILESLQISSLAAQAVSDISGGERQRVALARAAVAEPEILLLDEPSAHQDAEHLELVLALIRGAAQRGACVVVATHDPRVLEALDLAQTLRLSGGRLEGSA